MNLRRQRARVLALGFLVLTPAAALGSTPTAITALPDAAFEPVTAASLGVPDGPSATNAQPSSIASAKPYVRPTPAPSPSRPAPPPQTAHVQTAHATSNAHPAVGRSSIRGTASWYCNADGRRAVRSKCMAVHPDTRGFDAYAAAGPRLRVAMGGGVSIHAPDPWRGKIVTVCGRTCQRVKLADWCKCDTDPAHPKLLDLYYDVYALTGGPVTVSW